MALEVLKRATLAVYLKLLLKRLDSLTEQVVRANDIAEKRLKLEAVKANIRLSTLADAEETEPEQPAGPGAPAGAMELLTQSPEELASLNEAYEHAENRFGRGKVPLDLDLYAYSATLTPDSPDEEA